MSLRRRLGNFCLFIGIVALALFALDAYSWEVITLWGALPVGLGAVALAVLLRPGRDPAPPPPTPRPATAPKSAAPAKAAASPKPGGLGGLFKPKAAKPAAAPAPKPAAPPPPPPKRGLAGLFAPKPKGGAPKGGAPKGAPPSKKP